MNKDMDIREIASTTVMLLANASGAEFEDEQMAIDIIEETIKKAANNCKPHVIGQSELLNPNKELLDCVHNLMGYFDTPIARMKMGGKDCEEVRKIGREVLSKHNVDWQGV